jgi:NAD-dependent dihydropyrimidine dehydrogenase PreA subunit
MTYDPQYKKIKFNKNESKTPGDNFELEIDPATANDLCPCVNLCSANDSVELINQVKF